MSKSFPARRALTALAAIAILASTHPAPAANGAALYRIENSIPLGGPERLGLFSLRAGVASGSMWPTEKRSKCSTP